MKGDFSRSTFDPNRPYSSVRMQQGRVPVDADWNEQVDITDYQRRRAITDIIGGCCISSSVPDSFRVAVENGALQVDGGRAWVRGILAERADAQTLPMPAAGRYVVYLQVFERHVTAIEDPNIREVALGGPDTATRTATVCLAGLAPIGESQRCADLRDFAPPEQTTGQLVASTGAQPPDTPCVVPAAAGYARLENQLYRVEIQRSGEIGGTSPPTFKWSRDNGSIAAPWLELDGNEIVIPDAGRDDVLGFHDNRWIELGHDALDVAGATGMMVEVVARRTDSTGRFRLQFDAHGQVVPDPTTLDHPKVRRWDHDADSDPAAGAIPINAADTAIALEGGIEVEFSAGRYRAGDFWLIPARTFSGASTGDILWPRDGGGNPLPQPPHGVARFFCRLAVVSVAAGGGAQIVEDCRHIFPPLCEVEGGSSGCCTVTVGTDGDEPTIAAALARLTDDGGEICILPGTYTERVILDGRRNVTIHGCGLRTRIVAPDANPVFSLRDVRNVSIRTLAIEALQAIAIHMDDARTVSIEEVAISARDRTAVVGNESQAITVRECNISIAPRPPESPQTGRPVAVFLAGEDLRVERNRIIAPSSESPRLLPGGGLQIGGGSENIDISGNEISGGFGPGILLGSVSSPPVRPNFGSLFDTFVASRETNAGRAAGSSVLNDAATYFANLRREPGRTRAIDHPQLGFVAGRPSGRNVVSDGDLADVRIVGNRIQKTGGSGITAAHFFDLVEGDGDFITVHRLEIADNAIDNCVFVRHEPVPESLAEDSALGGIALADARDLVIRDNTIDGTGALVGMPACGIFVLHSEGLDIHRNRIRHNGVRPQDDPEIRPDRRGGIVIGFAEVPTREVQTSPESDIRRLRQDGTPAIRIHDNLVIAPQGRAIEAIAHGPVSVADNQLTALGADFRRGGSPSGGIEVPERSPLEIFVSALGGAVVWLMNLGVSNEVYLQLSGFSGLGLGDALPDPTQDPNAEFPLMAGGNILLANNQIILDALDGITTIAFSAISLFTLDDVGLTDNQIDCDMVSDVVVANALVFGTSVRATSNRFKQGVANALYSAVTVGYLNWTIDNHGTHCFVRVGKQFPLPGENMVLRELLEANPNFCAPAQVIERQLHDEFFPE